VRAFAVESFGGAPTIHDLPIPTADGAFVIRVTYAGVNPIDYKLVDQLTAASRFPFVVGIDFAGVLEHVPTGEEDLQVGDRVFGTARIHGSYTEYTAVVPGAQAEPVARIPDGVTDKQAAVLPIPATTALGSLELLRVAADQRVVVMGAAGSVGGYAVQMARPRSAHVIGTVRGGADEAHRLGADDVYDTNAGDAVDAIRAAHPDGVDAVLDLVNGPDAIRRDAGMLKARGRLVSTVYAADEDWFAERNIAAYNIASISSPMSSRQGLTEVARTLAAGTITARVGSTVGLEGAADTFDKLRNGALRGKAVIRTDTRSD
jgi:NADPH:quinone reductase-like Zn-dependent oxidoreductase